MEPKTEIQKEPQKREMDIREALDSELLRGAIRAALNEWWEWYTWRYAMPVSVEIGEDYVALYISYDITEEEEVCERACIEEAKKNVDSEEYSEEDIVGGCYVACHEDVVTDTNEVFSNVWINLWHILDKYQLKYDWEMSWDYNTKYLSVVIKQ